jgi:transcriptional regulator with XRE-family HTH domain
MPKTDLVRLDVRAVDAARLRRCMTLGELGRRAGLARATLYLMHAGRPISLGTARLVAAALRVSLRRLLADDAAGTARRLGAVLTGVIPERENWR